MRDPLAIVEIDPDNPADHVVEHADEERISADCASALGLAFSRSPDKRLLRSVGISLPLFEIDRDEGVGREGRSIDFPIHIRGIEQMPIDDAVERCLQRNVETQPFAILLDEVLCLEKADAAKGRACMNGALVVAQQAGTRPDVLAIAAEDFLRLVDRLAAFPETSRVGILAFRHQRFVEVARDEQRVFIDPFDAALALGQFETALDKSARGHIEFAHDGGVLAAV